MRTSLRRVRHCRQVDSSLVARADLPRNMCALMSAVQTDLRHIDPKIRRRVGSKTQRSTQLKNRGPALRMPPAAMIFIISAVRSLPLLPALPHYLACFGGLIAEMPESGSGVGHKLGCGSQMRSPASAMTFSSISTSSRTPVSRPMTSAVDSMKDGLRSITLAARKAPSVVNPTHQKTSRADICNWRGSRVAVNAPNCALICWPVAGLKLAAVLTMENCV